MHPFRTQGLTRNCARERLRSARTSRRAPAADSDRDKREGEVRDEVAESDRVIGRGTR